MLDKIFKKSPYFLQNILISAYNIKANSTRFGGNYSQYLEKFRKNSRCSFEELKEIQSREYEKFIVFAFENSIFFQKRLKNIQDLKNIKNLKKIPILTKKELADNIETVNTTNKTGIASSTGGTTGKSLTVYFTADNIVKRFAFLDYFRSWYGYKLGKKTAWFSGKDIITEKDSNKYRFWKTDYYNRVRYYSTFHIKNQFLKYYIDDLIKYRPEFISGFPTSIGEVALYGLKNNIDFPANIIRAVFTTSETVTPQIRKNIEQFFKTDLYNQYSASEGAPFIFECKNHNLHLEMQSGIVEVLDDEDNDALEGRVIITSFTTYGTPLIRYDIGDKIKLSSKSCSCGNNNPLVENILGRTDDFIFSPENGKMNLVNIANGLKDVSGILRTQIIQDKIDAITIKLIKDDKIYSQKEEDKLLKNFRARLGDTMKIKLDYVENLEVEKSGKFRIVKNSIKHLIK